MSHEITFQADGTAEAAFSFAPPWWDPSFPVLDHAMTSAEALTMAHLDWEVQARPLAYQSDDRTFVPTTAVALVRPSDAGLYLLGVATSDYHILQNREAFEMLDILHGEGGLKFLSAGSLRGGKQVFMMGELPTDFTLAGNKHKKHLACINDHTGSAKVRILACDTRIVCANTVAAGIQESESDGLCVSFRHSGNIKEKVQHVRNVLTGAENQFSQWYHHYAVLMERKCSPYQFDCYVKSIFPKPLQTPDQPIQLQDRMMQRYEAKRQQVIDNWLNFTPTDQALTWYAGFNAITQHVDHQLNYRTAGSRFHNVILNSGATLKRHALKLALQMSKEQ